mgnify:CR=1 FL=1
MDRAIDAAPPSSDEFGGVDDGVNAQRGDVGNNDFQPRLADLAREPDSGRGCRADGDALVGEQLLQFTGLEHLADDVAAADELALDVELRDGRPVRVGP